MQRRWPVLFWVFATTATDNNIWVLPAGFKDFYKVPKAATERELFPELTG